MSNSGLREQIGHRNDSASRQRQRLRLLAAIWASVRVDSNPRTAQFAALLLVPAVFALSPQLPSRHPRPEPPQARPGSTRSDKLDSHGCHWDEEVGAYRCRKNRAEDFVSYQWFRSDLADFANQISDLLKTMEGGPPEYTVVVQGFADCVFHPSKSMEKHWEHIAEFAPPGPELAAAFANGCVRHNVGLIDNEDVAFLRSCLTALLLREALNGSTTVEELKPVAYEQGDKEHCGPKHRAVEIYLRHRGSSPK
jgi:hypothetical protein